MLTNQDRPRGLIVINGKAYPADEVINALERQAMTQLRVIGDTLWIGNQQIRPLAKTTAEQAMMLTCFGSLAYCCPLSRECSRRDEALRMLGMTKEEYNNIKREAHQRFLRFADERWPYGESQSSNPQPIGDTHRLTVQSPVGQSTSTRSYIPTLTHTQSSSPRSPQPPQPHLQTMPSATSRLGSTQPGRFGRPSLSGSQNPKKAEIPSGETVDLGGLFGSQLDDEESRPSSQMPPLQASSLQVHTRKEGGFNPESWRISASSPTSTIRREYPSFCIHCGQDLQEGAEFCPKCGRRQD